MATPKPGLRKILSQQNGRLYKVCPGLWKLLLEYWCLFSGERGALCGVKDTPGQDTGPMALEHKHRSLLLWLLLQSCNTLCHTVLERALSWSRRPSRTADTVGSTMVWTKMLPPLRFPVGCCTEVPLLFLFPFRTRGQRTVVRSFTCFVQE